MSEPKTDPKQPKPTTTNRMKVKVKWVDVHDYKDGEFEPSTGLVYAKRNGRDAIGSIHSGMVVYVVPAA